MAHDGSLERAPQHTNDNENDPATGAAGSAHGYRILVVDDNPAIHDDFERILETGAPRDLAVDELAVSLLGVTSARAVKRFELDSVFQGQDALAAVIRANEQDRPYALVFMDVRMPPGWNGVETAERLFEVDEFVHVILCTAYADREWRQRVKDLQTNDRVLLLNKPFDPLEVKQLTNAMCAKWQLARRDKARMEELERSISDKNRELESANRHLRKEIAERARAERDLRKAQRLEGLGRMAAGLCHEINNPLNFIVGSIEGMEEILDETRPLLPNTIGLEVADLLNAAATGADRITQLVRNFKLFARQTDAEAELVDVRLAVDVAVEMVRRSLGEHVRLVTEYHEQAPLRILGRRVELEQVLINLIENAGQAMTTQLDREARIDVRLLPADKGHMHLAIRDTGPGIPETIIEKIFDPFFTTKPVNQGTGLGLSICHSLVHGMNGTIEVDSALGRGTTFTITLPAVAVEPAVAKTPPSNDPIDSHSSGDHSGAEGEKPRARILLVDDEPFILKVLGRMLRGHDVTPVSSAHDAISLCITETYDIILSDIMMPGVSGRDFYNLLATERPGEEEKIVFITGGTLIEEVLDFLDSVANVCLEKPVDTQLLREIVAERVSSRST